MGDLARRAIEAGLLGDGDDFPPAPAKYAIERCLGTGGAGSVYLANDTSLGRPVALKYLHHVRAVEVERFLREARFAARLQNPAIVQIYEAGEVEGLPYIAMQYVPGKNLADAELDLQGVVLALRQVAEALAHAHREGIVHRDIKPENILVDAEGRAFLTDFGIARDLRGELGATISQDGQIMGTPALMPPEQARGDIHAVDARSDVYALGATAFTRLTGRWPFEGESVVEVLHAVLHEDPPFPRTFNASIPRPLESVVVRCMQKRRRDRYESMREVVRALDECLARQPDTDVSSSWFASYVRNTVEEAPARRESADETDGDLEAAMDAAREVAGFDADLYRVRTNLPRLFPRLDRLIERLDRVLEERPAAGWARFYRGLARARRGDTLGGLEDMERAIDRVGDRRAAYFELGRMYLALHGRERRDAERHIVPEGGEDSLRLARSRLEEAAHAFAEAAADDASWRRRFAEAVKLRAEGDAEGARRACDAILEEDPDLEEVWKFRGDLVREAGGDAADSYRHALQVRRSHLAAAVALAEVLLARGERDGAREALEGALEVHPGHAPARALLARVHLEAGDLDRGLAEARAAREADRRDYDAAIVTIELLLRKGAVEDALTTVEAARNLHGCQNRVSVLRARALLLRAGRTREKGGDPRRDLEEVAGMRRDLPAVASGRPPWSELIDQAERELSRL